jgi:hypothetical protein
VITLEIDITQEDIDANGHIGTNCPAHRALVRKYPKLRGHVAVGQMVTAIKGRYFKNPYLLAQWIRQYDFHHPIGPGRFELEVESNVLEETWYRDY